MTYIVFHEDICHSLSKTKGRVELKLFLSDITIIREIIIIRIMKTLYIEMNNLLKRLPKDVHILISRSYKCINLHGKTGV